ncbi:MAG: superoxide dismutase family protein [Clostridia bacterium]|nr:superoxide dismutase family protein [Clostridia bacterium]
MYTYHSRSRRILDFLSRTRPSAVAQICGTVDFPGICGTLMLYQSHAGVFAVVSVSGIPAQIGQGNVLGMHIHDPATGKHYNPHEAAHPYHAGDFPPLFVDGSDAWCAFLAERFQVCEVIGKTVVIHRRRDDFTTQPSGDSGEKIACGEIKKNISFN